jgi:methyl-accepting chemotaxis protein
MSSDIKMIQHKLKGLLQQSDQAMELIAYLKESNANANESNNLIDQLAQSLEKIAAELKGLKQ